MKRKKSIVGAAIVDVPLPDEISVVAQGNDIEVSPGAFVVMGAMDYWPADTPAGHCKYCGCPPERMPMVNRGTGWCCENHRKELEKERGQEKA